VMVRAVSSSLSKTIKENLRGGPGMGGPGYREGGADPGYVPDGMGGGPG
jgi:hypothetical protein